MISFECDYLTGAHPAILRRLAETNLEPASGYGADPYTASAKEKIRAACACPDADICFLTGGTQTNAAVISSVLKEYEGVIAADSGHISQHESGAVEFTGHKVITLPGQDGKLRAPDIRAFLTDFYLDANREHMVFPGMVYLSFPTELGTLYSRQELSDIASVCSEYKIPLYLDGARLGYGLMSPACDLTLPDIARLCDVFYIGGTKVGALCGEAVVFPKHNMPPHFMNMIKRRGALAAKGRLLGVQFDTLFTDDLYFDIGRHAIKMAGKLVTLLKEKGCRFYLESPTNQQFVIMENEQFRSLRQKVGADFWCTYDFGQTVVRFVTCWSTTDEDLAYLSSVL